MNLNVLTPEAVRHCYDGLLVRTAVEYRHALDMLRNVRLAQYEQLTQQIAAAVCLIEEELERRSAEAASPAFPAC